jgi:NhaP-type Na+/H+ or K+/H+ antiporter
MVLINAAVLAPFILFVLGFSSRGWDWIHAAILAAMLAPTDAVAVTAILKAGGGPENMVVLMEGEALLNDASAVTLYTSEPGPQQSI